jgi:hypothetical protein
MPLDAVSIGRPGMEIGAPGRPGLASRMSPRTKMRCAGSGAKMSAFSTSAVTVTDSSREAIQANFKSALTFSS